MCTGHLYQNGFASDNTSGVHQKVMQALLAANEGPAVPYGDDPWTERAVAGFHSLFGEDVDVFLVPHGTGANVLALRAMVRPWRTVLLADVGHPVSSESSAVEAVSGCRLALLPSCHGKVDPADIAPAFHVHTPHETAPGVLALTQSTELGTVYTADELRALCAEAHTHGIPVFMDGARFANAVAATGQDPRTLARETGVDVMTFGGTKNGLMYGEAILFFNRTFAQDFATQRKQALQLVSKQRFLGAQFEAYLEGGLWLEMAAHANAMARRLADGVAGHKAVSLVHPVETNGVFLSMQPAHQAQLLKQFLFHEVDAAAHTIRLMCAFNTTPAEVDNLVTAVCSLK